MKFHSFYNKVYNRLIDSILSLWATGDKDLQDYFKFLLDEEPIMSEVVFQGTFPWEPSDRKFGECVDLFDNKFVKALEKIKNEEFRFPIDRNPYKHQLKSWKELIQSKKSIAVTTGTGSGKTECFMLPVLYDLHKNCKNQEGINAIFLYPLNALIASQRKRMHAWCSALDGLKYALLTGDTKDRVSSKEAREKAKPELISREQIRNSPPQILFTNPSMLEYMLVRNADVPILEKSQGKLRWILLDEAHTLTGSTASEMALLIRRVIDAFGVNASDLRFAITSATVGSDNSEILKKFMSNLCGISCNQIVVIQGQRVNDQISKDKIKSIPSLISADKIHSLRDQFLNKNVISQSELCKLSGLSERKDALHLLDTLSETRVDNQSILPIRGHFFTRGVGGVYVCANTACDKHNEFAFQNKMGTMYTIARKQCSCGHPLLELMACRTCGNLMLEGEERRLRGGGRKISQKTTVGYEAFSFDEEHEESIQDESNQEQVQDNRIWLARNSNSNNIEFDETCSITSQNDIIAGNDFGARSDHRCLHCGNSNEYPIYFRISSSFTNRILSDLILDQTQEEVKPKHSTLYKGKKYISFTDSRQGTAKIAAMINIDSEADWIRYQVYHSLVKSIKENSVTTSDEELVQQVAYYERQLETAPPFAKKDIQKKLEVAKSLLQNGQGVILSNSRCKWQDILDKVITKKNSKILFNKVAKSEQLNQIEYYIKSLIFDQFSKRLIRERSLENLGLVKIVYPELSSLKAPEIAIRLNINDAEWRDLLKISLDYILRYKTHFVFDDRLRVFTSKRYQIKEIFPSNSEVVGANKWPTYNPNSITQNRLVLLICAGLGWHEREEIDTDKESDLIELLDKMWRILVQKILERDDEGYKLDFFNKTQVELSGKVLLCPVTKRLIDTSFRGYTPWIKGSLNRQNIQNYVIDNSMHCSFDPFPYPFHLNDENQVVDEAIVASWIEENSKDARSKGLWNDLHERIYNKERLFLAGEHSAQQTKKRLSELEEQFEEGDINILSCSTTMEMGVDIGGISAVVMSNVPPMPANYLQRTGRAGRRSENKSLALTFCAPNPVGLRTMNNPKWALEHKIAPPILAFDSKRIVERHLNSLLFGVFIRQQGDALTGLNIKENIEGFFLNGNASIGLRFLSWLEADMAESTKVSIERIVHNIPGFSTKKPINILYTVRNNFRDISDRVKEEEKNFDTKLEELKAEFGENSPAYKAVNYAKGQFLRKFVLNFLAEEGFLPNAGLPTGILEFEKTTLSDLRNINPNFIKSNPSYTAVRALTEFAPGNSILIDGQNFNSSGIILRNAYGDTAERLVVQGCNQCGYQRTVKQKDRVAEDCPKCLSSNSFRGIQLGDDVSKFTELIEPVGFSIDLFSTPTRVISPKIKPQYLEPLLLNIDPWEKEQAQIIDYRTNNIEEEAEILFYNNGEGEGYSICLDCGRVETSHDRLDNHKRLRGGKDADGESTCASVHIKDRIILGSRFRTNFTEIRLKDSDGEFVNSKELLFTLGVIFTKVLASYLAIEESELGFGIKKYKRYKTIFIYDTAKGGAGYSSQFKIYTKEILQESLAILDNCNCNKACTKCLIDRFSQWHIEDLNRVIAIEWLENALAFQVPTDLNDAQPIFGSLEDEIRRLHYHFGIKEIDVHVNNHISQWDLNEMYWLDNLIRDRIKVNLIVEGDPNYNSFQDKLAVHILANSLQLKKGERSQIMQYSKQLTVVLENYEILTYLYGNEYFPLTATWPKDFASNVYNINKSTKREYSSIVLPELSNHQLFESRIQSIGYNKLSDDVAGIMISNLANREAFMDKVKGVKYKVSYYDKYNQSEFSLRLLLQFVEKLSLLCSFELSSFSIHLAADLFSGRIPYYMINNYTALEDYEQNLNSLSEDFEFNTYITEEVSLPHYRYFKFESEENSFEIRIDGGISHGLKPVDFIKSGELTFTNKSFAIKKDVSYDLIYNVSMSG